MLSLSYVQLAPISFLKFHNDISSSVDVTLKETSENIIWKSYARRSF
jgi:hypothetical protein